jgi:hypothetical protein
MVGRSRYGGRSSAELKVQGEQTGGHWAVVGWHVRPRDEGPIHTHTHRHAAWLLVTLVPAGAEYFFVPRGESDRDPAKVGLGIQAQAARG